MLEKERVMKTFLTLKKIIKQQIEEILLTFPPPSRMKRNSFLEYGARDN